MSYIIPAMEKNALQLLCRFSMPPNSLGYCGKDSATNKFRKCISEGKCVGVASELKKFIVLYPYLKLISTVTHLPIFSTKVAEAYWMGNEILEKIEPKHYKILLNNFSSQGVPEWLIKDLEEKAPSEFVPTHLFQVLYIGVGRASGSVPFNIKTINDCMVRWGEVTDISIDRITVNLHSLKKSGENFVMVTKEEKLSYDKAILGAVRKGSIVAVHWRQPVKILSLQEERRLDYWTQKTLQVLHTL